MGQQIDEWEKAWRRLVTAFEAWQARTGGSQTLFAKRVKVHQSTVSQWLNPNVKQRPDAVQMLLIPKALDISERWWVTGQGPMLPETSDTSALYYRGGEAALLAMEEALREVKTRWQEEADRELQAGAEAARRRAEATRGGTGQKARPA